MNMDHEGPTVFQVRSDKTPQDQGKQRRQAKRTRIDPAPIQKNIFVPGGHIPFGPSTSATLAHLNKMGPGKEVKGKNGSKHLEKESTKEGASTPKPTQPAKHGIKTAMHVKILASNRLQFSDEPRPPDRSNMKHSTNDEAEDSSCAMEEIEGEDEEVVMEEEVAETPVPAPT